MNLLDLTLIEAQGFFLYFLRGAGFVFIAPIFSARAIPAQFKVALAGIFGMIFLMIHQPLLPNVPYSLAEWAPMAVGELVIGMSIGFLVGIIFVIFQFAGRIFGFQMGFAIVNVLDPESEEQVSLVGEFLFTVVSLVFLNLNLHHALIFFFGSSFDWVPAGGISAATFTIVGITKIFTSLFIVALQIAAPLLALLFMIDFGLGILARVVPQMNVFFVGMPLKIAAGLFMLSLVVLLLDPVTWRVTDRIFSDAAHVIREFGVRDG